ncbi:unnamed protein product [marine sediment metagenome]|uniref:Uncharacterized protein n=1 Tax=marine sediment metagenome TaxID=412755 RepID=X1KD62_9ZZZZ
MGHPVPIDEPPNYGVNCEHCDPGKTPHRILLTLSGIQSCDCYPGVGFFFNSSISINGSYILTQTPENNWCSWAYYAEGDFGYFNRFIDPNCEGESITTYFTEKYLWVYRDAGGLDITAHLDSSPVFKIATPPYPVDSECVYATGIPNKYGTCEEFLTYGAGGTATVKKI